MYHTWANSLATLVRSIVALTPKAPPMARKTSHRMDWRAWSPDIQPVRSIIAEVSTAQGHIAIHSVETMGGVLDLPGVLIVHCRFMTPGIIWNTWGNSFVRHSPLEFKKLCALQSLSVQKQLHTYIPEAWRGWDPKTRQYIHDSFWEGQNWAPNDIKRDKLLEELHNSGELVKFILVYFLIGRTYSC